MGLLEAWFAAQGLRDIEPIEKATADTRAWSAAGAGGRLFLKFYPQGLDVARVDAETAIAGANLHPAIVPLRQTMSLPEGTLLVYDWIAGENLGSQNARARFGALPLSERIAAVLAVFGALAAIADAGFMLVDWYEGNMLYDFAARRIRLFDWELCRRGEGFTLDMAANYGSSRLMAPEEFVRGTRLDQRTLVFNLGRYALLTLPELAVPLAPLLARATYPDPSGRYATLRAFTDAFCYSVPHPNPLPSLGEGVNAFVNYCPAK